MTQFAPDRFGMFAKRIVYFTLALISGQALLLGVPLRPVLAGQKLNHAATQKDKFAKKQEGTLPSSGSSLASAAESYYLLKPVLGPGHGAVIEVDLEVGGDLLVQEGADLNYEEGETPSPGPVEKKLPLRVVAKLRYQEHLLAWSTKAATRSIRYYDTAQATIKVGQEGLKRTLADTHRLILTEVRDSRVVMNGLHAPLTRAQEDLLQVVGDTLVLDRLLPGQRLAKGESWTHDAQTIGALLGMDHVALCEVSSVVTGEDNGQVRLRLAGSVHGTIDGAATELELRGAYLFDRAQERISRFNLAIKEHRKTGPVSPGLDVVAKLKLKVHPKEPLTHLDEKVIAETEKLDGPISHELLYDSPQHGFRFRYDDHWYITAEGRDRLALRLLHNSTLVAHCNVSTLTARAAGRQTTLVQFEREIRQTLGDRLDDVKAAKEWTTATGHHCLGIIVNGKIKDVPLQWRYYLIAADGMPRISLLVTVERAQIKNFADADRHLVESLKLTGQSAQTTAARPAKTPAR